MEAVVERMHAVLRGEVALEEAAATLGVDPSRLKIYRNFVRHHVRTVLEKLYPMVRGLVGEAVWDDLVSRFFVEVPSRSWELNACAEPFPALLDRIVSAGEPDADAFLVALAQFEWEEFATYMNLAEIPEPGSLSSPAVNPTVAILSFDFPVVPFVVAHPDPTALSPQDKTPERLATPELALMFRRPGGLKIGYYQGNDDLLFALKVVHEGLDIEEAARMAGHPIAAARRAIARAMEIGLLIH